MVLPKLRVCFGMVCFVTYLPLVLAVHLFSVRLVLSICFTFIYTLAVLVWFSFLFFF